MAQQQPSELLRVLGQLGDAAWAEALLPLLTANKSAGAVALTCKQLRQLCQGNQRELKLTGANCKHLGPMELDAFSRRFPACSSVAFTAASVDEITWHLSCVLPMLARLPQLQSLQLTINSDANQPDCMAPALQLLRLQLPQLRSLQLVLCSSWNSQQCWTMLGAATQLTKLAIDFKIRADSTALSLQHLSALRPLGSSLQHLELTAERIDHHIPEDCSFLSSFSGLTRLVLPLISTRTGLTTISSCTALQHLRLYRQGSAVLDAAECDALAQLTRLTHLDIPPSSDTPALLSALQCLSGLQVLGLRDMSSQHLPVLVARTKLTRLHGRWLGEPPEQPAAGAAGTAPTACPSITTLRISGPFPPAAFPGARNLIVKQIMQPSHLMSISQHMKELELLSIGGHDDEATFRSLEPSAAVSERVAAVRNFGALPSLSRLYIALNDDAEAAALGTVTQVQHLMLYVPRGSSVSTAGLSSVFFRLRKLPSVIIVLLGLLLSQPEAMSLLSGLSDVSSVTVTVNAASPEQCDVWQAAATAARSAGLPLPANYSFC